MNFVECYALFFILSIILMILSDVFFALKDWALDNDISIYHVKNWIHKAACLIVLALMFYVASFGVINFGHTF